MARVVQRRTSPPYLLIVLAFLFVAATTAFFVVLLKWDDPDRIKEKEKDLWAKVATPDERDRLKTSDGTTVVGNLQKQIRELTKAVTGHENSAFQDAISQSEKAKANVALASRGSGFIDLLVQVQSEKLALQGERDRAMTDMEAAIRDKASVIEAQKTELTTFKTQEDALTAKLGDANTEKEKLQKENNSQITSIKEDNQKAIDGLNKEIEKATGQVTAAQKKLDELSAKYGILLKQFRDANKPPFDPEAPLAQAKGKVSEVVDQVAYIDRGSKDRIVPGMTFSVFTPGTLTPDAKPKAMLTVANVSANTSECKIKDAKTTNPVLSGDVIQNVVYDPQRVYTFVVMGDFDLHQAGKANHQSQDEVKDMIHRSGGKTADELTIRTDYLVLGEEPSRPPALAAEHTAQDEEVNAAQMKAYDEYSQAKRKAAELYITVLNANRFLNLMGYSPIKEK
jgi:hypothetical protein